MYSSASIIDIKDILTQKFSEELFTEFAINLVNLESKDLLNSIYFEEDSKTYEKYIDYVKDIGRYRDTDKNTILLSIIKLKESPENARTMQRNFIAKHMGELDADASIVALYSEKSDIWRISFVKLDYTVDIDGIHEKLTPAKRYSYLIDPSLNNHTAQEQLSKLYYEDSQKATLLDIENVFSVEVVTDEFFKMYKEKYLDLKELLEKDNNFIAEAKALNIEINDFSEEFAKKLMGQISFLYFLQKKGWLGVKIVPKKIAKVELREIYRRQNEEVRSIINKVYNSKNEFMLLSSLELKNLSNDDAEKLASSFKNTKYDEEWGTGTRQFIRTIFNTSQNNNFNFFNEYLEPLFYNALNTKRGNTEYYQLFNCKIPFLNGGLFEPIYKYDWKNTSIQIQNIFFANENNKGLLDLFDMYNFTINEDEPLEKEVAVDPEMLGKIFENLLEVKERKSKGAFYTPREIVHYMCQESLISYLSNETGIFYDDIDIFIKYGEIIKDADMNIHKKENYKMPKIIVDNFEKIDKALENVKIADPSVGSGAFPLGMLNEIVKARSIITDYIYKNSDEMDMFYSRSIYNLKKKTMKKSIFAVDIEPSAVDITKLRLWLSLVVDADEKTVNTLPNLDYNVMVGNSLIEDFRGIKLFDEELLKEKLTRKQVKESRQISMNIDENNEINIGIEQEYQLLEDIQSLQSKLFDTKDTEIKKSIKKEIEDKEWELIEYKLNREKGLSFKEIQELKKQRKLHKRPYFLWKLEFSKVFKENNGFDIVISNPPYIQLQKNHGKLANELKNQGYNTFARTGDIYCIFYEKGLSLLKEKGILCYITSNKWMRAGYGEKLRGFLAENSNPIKLIDFSGTKVFESATVDVNIFIASKEENKKYTLACTIEDNCIKNLSDYISQNSSKNIYTSNDNWIISNQIELSIKNKIEKIGTKLSDWNISINRGILTGYNEAFIISTEKKNELIEKDPKSAEIIRPILRGRDIKRYGYDFARLWLIYIPWHFPLENDSSIKGANKKAEEMFMEKYPIIYNHLLFYKEQLSKRNKSETGIRYEWYALQRWGSKYKEDFYKKKIIFQEMVQKPAFFLDSNHHFFCLDTGRIITGQKLEYLTALLNSKIFFFCIKYFYGGGCLGKKGVRMKHTFFYKFPAYVPTNTEEIYIKNLILNEKVNIFDDEIDNFFYDKYHLNIEEINYINSKI